MLLTAWVEDSTQTVMAATEVPPEEFEQQGDGFGVASKGYQQVTSWQVFPSPPLPLVIPHVPLCLGGLQ